MSEMFFESLRYFAGKAATARLHLHQQRQQGQPARPAARDVRESADRGQLLRAAQRARVQRERVDQRRRPAHDGGDRHQLDAARSAALTNAVGTAEGITAATVLRRQDRRQRRHGLDGLAASSCARRRPFPGWARSPASARKGPRSAGSYLIAGLAHHARTNRIRTDITGMPATDTRSLKVTTYGIQLATNVPQLDDPGAGQHHRPEGRHPADLPARRSAPARSAAARWST